MNPMLFYFLFISTARADDVKCDRSFSRIEKRIAVADTINWFIRPDPKNQEVTFTVDGGNRNLNMDTEVVAELPGEVDPSPSPDGMLLAVPVGMLFKPGESKPTLLTNDNVTYTGTVKYKIVDSKVLERDSKSQDWKPSSKTLAQLKSEKQSYFISAMAFYSKANAHLGQPLLVDQTINYNYQSLGVLSSTAQKTRYRMLVEGDQGLLMREYELNKSTGQLLPEGTTHLACAQPLNATMPMLSKDGKMFSVFDHDAGTTKIYEINPTTNKCKLKVSIKVMAGKMDFSPNGQMTAFHVDDSGDIPEEFSHPMDGHTGKMALFVLDIKSKKITEVPDAIANDAYYPVFLSDSRLAYAARTQDANGTDHYYINSVKLNPNGDCLPLAEPDPIQKTRSAE